MRQKPGFFIQISGEVRLTV